MRSPVAVRLQDGGIGRVASSARRAKSFSSIMCCVPILVAFSLPERIQRRTVSGSRFVRRAASGTVSIVATYYNNSAMVVQQRPCETMLFDATQRYSANSDRHVRTGRSDLLTARFRVRIPVPEPVHHSCGSLALSGLYSSSKIAACASSKVAKLDLFESCQLPSEERVLSAGSESMKWMIACASSSGNCPTTP